MTLSADEQVPAYPVVRVVWLDSVILPGWQAIDELMDSPNSVVVQTFGFLVHEDERVIDVAVAIHGHEAAGVVRILKATVTEREEVRGPSEGERTDG